MKLLLILASTMLLMSSATDVSMYGIKIGDSSSVCDTIQLSIEAKEGNKIKYQTKNGNDLAITFSDGKVVYMENDWMHEKKGSQSLIPNLIFGKNTLRDIRNRFGTNGFVYKKVQFQSTLTDIILFNCFELDSPNNEILVIITKMKINIEATEETVADELKLEAIIIADRNYLDKIWGKKKIYDTNYKKVIL